MPMHQLRIFSVVKYVDRHLLALSKSQERAGGRAVVSNCLDDFSWSDFQVYRRDAESCVSLGRLDKSLRD